jgi:hypothetical protein
MKYRIANPGLVDPAALASSLHEIDPAAVVDLQAAHGALRISTWATEADLRSLLAAAGLPVVGDQLERLPSECCGGCGG